MQSKCVKQVEVLGGSLFEGFMEWYGKGRGDTRGAGLPSCGHKTHGTGHQPAFMPPSAFFTCGFLWNQISVSQVSKPEYLGVVLLEEPNRGLPAKTQGLQVGLEHGEFAWNVLSGWHNVESYTFVLGSWEKPGAAKPAVDFESNPSQKVNGVGIPALFPPISWMTTEQMLDPWKEVWRRCCADRQG